MKRIGLAIVSVIAFFFIAAPIYMKYEGIYGVNLNGKPSMKAQFVNNQWAVPLDEFSRAFGGGVTLEPNFQLQGNKLISVSSGGDRLAKKVEPSAQKVEPSASQNTIGGSVAPGVKISAGEKPFIGGALHVRKAGIVSNNVFMFNGKAFVPLADIARAFGGTFTAPTGNLQPNQSLSLNFAVNGDGILGTNP